MAMANNFVAIDSSKRLGSQTLNAIGQIAYALDALRLLKNTMDNMGDGVTYATIEAQFGLPAGKGQVFYQYVAGAVADLNASAFIQPLTYALAVGR